MLSPESARPSMLSPESARPSMLSPESARPSMIQLTQLSVVGGRNNAFSTDRSETWTLEAWKEVATREEAETLCRQENFRRLPGDLQGSLLLRDGRPERVTVERCLPSLDDPLLYKYMRVFVDPPKLAVFLAALKDDGVRVIRE